MVWSTRKGHKIAHFLASLALGFLSFSPRSHVATFPLLVGRRGRLWASSTPRYGAARCASRLVMQHRLHSDPYPLDTFRVNCRAAAWGRLNPSQQPSAIPSTGRAAGSGTDLARGPQLLGSLDISLLFCVRVPGSARSPKFAPSSHFAAVHLLHQVGDERAPLPV